MAGIVYVRTRLSDATEALMRDWETTINEVDVEDPQLGDAIAAFIGVVTFNLRHAYTRATTSVVSTGRTKVSIVIDLPPFTELAMREVMDAIRGVGLLDRRVARIREMTQLLQGGDRA